MMIAEDEKEKRWMGVVGWMMMMVFTIRRVCN